MKTVRICLNSIDKVKSFVNDLTKFDVDFDLVSGRYVIDAKSIMGIFSLDLSKPIDLNIHCLLYTSLPHMPSNSVIFLSLSWNVLTFLYFLSLSYPYLPDFILHISH